MSASRGLAALPLSLPALPAWSRWPDPSPPSPRFQRENDPESADRAGPGPAGLPGGNCGHREAPACRAGIFRQRRFDLCGCRGFPGPGSSPRAARNRSRRGRADGRGGQRVKITPGRPSGPALPALGPPEPGPAPHLLPARGARDRIHCRGCSALRPRPVPSPRGSLAPRSAGARRRYLVKTSG